MAAQILLLKHRGIALRLKEESRCKNLYSATVKQDMEQMNSITSGFCINVQELG